MFNFKSFLPDSPLSILIISIFAFIVFLFTKKSTISDGIFFTILFLFILLIFLIIDDYKIRKKYNAITQKTSKKSVKANKNDLNFNANTQIDISHDKYDDVHISPSFEKTTININNINIIKNKENNNENK